MKLLELYLAEHKNAFVRHAVESFDYFLDEFVPSYFRRECAPNGLVHTASGDRDIRIWFGGRDGAGFRVLSPRNEDGSLMFPQNARLEDRSYCATMLMDVDIEYAYTARNGEAKTLKMRIEDHVYGRFPIPVWSKYCNLHSLNSDEALYGVGECINELGGYFIIDGSERFLRSQESLATGVLNVYFDKPDNTRWYATAEVRSGDVSVPAFSHYVHDARMKEAAPKQPRDADDDADNDEEAASGLLARIRKGGLWFESPMFMEPVPLVILMRALGAQDDQEIASIIMGDELGAKQFHNKLYETLILRTLEPGVSVFTPAQAMAWLKTKTRAQGEFALMDDLHHRLLPHIGSSMHRKLVFLGYMARRVLGVTVNSEPVTDRDHTRFKRLDCAGQLCSALFQRVAGAQIDNFIREVDKRLRYDAKRYEDALIADLLTAETLPTAYMPSHVVEEAFTKSFKGTWNGEAGVSQLLSRLNYQWTLSDLRRCRLRIGDRVKEREPRSLHTSQWGFFCPVESPDGPELGIVKCIAMFAVPSLEFPTESVLEALRGLSTFREVESPQKRGARVTVFLNGAIVGYASPPDAFHESVHKLRRSGALHKTVSLSWHRDEDTYWIYSDAGRLCRPLYRLDEGLLHEDDILGWSSWAEAEKHLDWVDASESDSLMVSMTPAVRPHVSDLSLLTSSPELVPQFTHSEIHGSFILGLNASLIPFAQHNAGTRNMFAVGQGRQGIGLYHTNYTGRFDQTSGILHNVESPLVQTHMYRHVGRGLMGNGQNAICAIMTYSGYNQEDSVILNEGALKRGLFLSTKFQTVSYTEEVLDSTSQTYISHPVTGKLAGFVTHAEANDYGTLDEDGVIKPGSVLQANSVLIGIIKPEANGAWRDASKLAGQHMAGYYVDAVHKFTVWQRGRFVQGVKVRVRKIRLPIVGDKMSIGSCANKGTVGLILPEQDMPFNAQGLRPDIIMNPHSIPTRMTMSITHEMLAGKAGLLGGYITDATAFVSRADPVAMFGERLLEAGYDAKGEEILYNGYTGEQINCSVFMCPVYYMRLKHMVADKWFSRATGGMTKVTKQPMAGRAVGGGLRIGEMERDSLISHGASHVLFDSLMNRSDGEVTLLHKPSGHLDTALDDQAPSRVAIPHAARVFLQELAAMHIDARLVTN